MAAGLVYKTMADGASPPGTFSAAFWDDGSGHLFPASVLVDLTTSQRVDFAAASPVFMAGRESELVPASSSTPTLLGASGSVGNIVDGLLVIPATTAPGVVKIRDGQGGSDITVFAGGTLQSVIPFLIPLSLTALNASNPGWWVTTGANVSVLGIGDFG